MKDTEADVSHNELTSASLGAYYHASRNAQAAFDKSFNGSLLNAGGWRYREPIVRPSEKSWWRRLLA